MACNEPGHWRFFLSHVQKEAGKIAVQLVVETGKAACWLDVNMQDKSELGMQEGVENSDIFVCILSEGYFKSVYCCKELQWALDAEKPIISVYPLECNVGAILKEAPEELAEIRKIESIKLDTSDPDYFEVGLSKMRKRIQAFDAAAAEKAAAEKAAAEAKKATEKAQAEQKKAEQAAAEAKKRAAAAQKEAAAGAPLARQRELAGKTIALYCAANDRWLRVTDAGGADAPARGRAFNSGWGWERFEVHAVGNEQVGLKNPVTGRWLRVLSTGKVDSAERGDFNSGWQGERFQLRDVGSGNVGVYSPKYDWWVCATDKGAAACFQRGAAKKHGAGAWERFVVEVNPPTKQKQPPAPKPQPKPPATAKVAPQPQAMNRNDGLLRTQDIAGTWCFICYPLTGCIKTEANGPDELKETCCCLWGVLCCPTNTRRIRKPGTNQFYRADKHDDVHTYNSPSCGCACLFILCKIGS